MVSQAVATGKVQVVPSLAEIQGSEFAEDVVIITDSVGGNEDIPVEFRLPQNVHVSPKSAAELA